MTEELKKQNETQMIIFRLGNEEYSIPITSVQEIIMPQKLTHLPKLPSIEGVINLRGHIIPIIDGKNKFGLSKDSKNTNDKRIIVLDIGKKIIGLIVDEVSEVIHLNTNDIDEPPVNVEGHIDYILGIGKYQDRLLILINPEKFLSHSEAKNINNLATVAANNITASKEKGKLKSGY